MEKIFSISSSVKTLFFVLFLFSITIQAQNILDNYEGIPIETNLDWWNIQLIPQSVDSMDSAGVDIIHVSFPEEANLQTFFSSNNFDVLPITTPKPGGVYNWIQYYTDAKYSVWEAEGNPPSEAKLEYYDSVMFRPYNANYISLKPEAAGRLDTLIWGPYYHQDVEYETYEDGNPDSMLVQYTAYFKLKLNVIGTDNANPTDALCILQVTQSNVSITGGWHLPCTDVIIDSVLTREDFTQLNDFKSFLLENYTLENFDCDSSTNIHIPPPQYRFSSETGLNGKPNGPRWIREYIQFKVIWLGNPNYSLSIDKVIVSDERGNALISDTTGLFAKKDIKDQSNSLSSYQNSVFGWLGIDEPVSIDLFEPIRVVDSILNVQPIPKRLVIPFMGSYSGAWNEFTNPYGVMHLSKWQEFKKRVGNVPIIQNAYLFDTPCSADSPPEHSICWTGEGYKAINIRIAAEKNYKQAYELDPDFGASLQCGAVFNDQANQRNVARHEVLYSANLALMYGAKFLQLWRYFPSNDINSINSGGTYRGIVDWVRNEADSIVPLYTDKYFMLKDTLSPRLKGLMGKTLKTLIPTNQVLDVSLNSFLSGSNFIKTIIKGGCTMEGMQPSTEAYDLGFFRDAQYGDYFMIINRWYSPACNPSLTVRLKPGYFSNYNLRVVDYINNQTFNTNRFGSISTAPIVGDAGFFGVFPVLTYGGSITANDTTNDYQTLLADMTIENGATLYVYETYNAEANITVKAGGKIENYENGKIIFSPGKQLIIEGTAEINGTANDRLSLEFSSATSEGIEVKYGGALNLSYCDVKNAQTGVKAEPGSGIINILNVNLTNCSQTGIALLGLQGDGPLTPPPPTIYNCNITGSSTGISVANYNEILVTGNLLTNGGISILSVTSAFIQANIIDGGSVPPFAGIFMDNSGGYIRCNFVNNCLNGIRLANSSPDVGSNYLEHNLYHGLYIGSGSIPNMIGRLINGPPYTWYGASGFNRIIENGMGEVIGEPSDNDGSEIYFSSSSALLGEEKRPGCNVIADDRESTPTMSTLYLMNGSLANDESELYAQNNYWGTTEPNQDRFERLPVIFSPYYLEPCPLPESGGEEELVLKTSSGIAVDTLYPSAFVPQDITALEASYAEADKHFIKLEMEQAKTIYEQIVQGNYTSEEKLPAYNKLYTIANLTRADESYFNSLQSALNNIANTETDTLLMKIYKQKAINCDVSKEEYLIAISKFDNIIQQNPNSEEAVYAEIDILTTALNLDTTNSGLGKIAGGKYLVKGTSDYLTKLNNLLQNKFGLNKEDQEQIIPKEYSLYQNYPNPFNPTTTIKFDLPKDGLVSLEIFDILGRRITTLVNENRNAGSHEQTFNASSLASGVYVYKLQAGDFVNSRKMLLLK
jgi:tetratricopeptide (TPR) repeat protein